MTQISDEGMLPSSSAYEPGSPWVGDDGSTPRDPSPLQRCYAVKGPKQPSQATTQVHSSPIHENARQMELTVGTASQRRNCTEESTEEAVRKLLKSFGERFVNEVRAKGNLALLPSYIDKTLFLRTFRTRWKKLIAMSQLTVSSLNSSPINRPVSPCES